MSFARVLGKTEFDYEFDGLRYKVDKNVLDDTVDRDLPKLINRRWRSDKVKKEYKERLKSMAKRVYA